MEKEIIKKFNLFESKTFTDKTIMAGVKIYEFKNYPLLKICEINWFGYDRFEKKFGDVYYVISQYKRAYKTEFFTCEMLLWVKGYTIEIIFMELEREVYEFYYNTIAEIYLKL